ncbi:MAG TPA: tocopherol cyclase family protein [Blastocatellia bacterium]|nr:tocopherol cyclase family protein [Blastocatellia bacterium]
MAVGFKTTASGAANYSDNLCRWKKGSSGHYEVWFLTLNDRSGRHGFWFRYTLESPLAAGGDRGAHAALWAAAFDRNAPERNFGLKSEFPIDQFLFEGREQFNLRIADGLFSPGQAAGRIDGVDHHIAWDLSFTPSKKTYHHVTPKLNLLLRPSSFVCSPNLDTRFSGSIWVDGEEMILEDEPGCQSHLWGSKRVDEWVWVHSNAFESHPGTVFEGLSARPRRAGRMMPPIQSLFLRHRGEEHRFVRMRFSEQWNRNLGIGYWSFSAMNPRLYIEGAAQCRLRDMLQATYEDPDGEPLYCVNSEVANLKIRLFRRTHGVRYRHVETIKARSTAHLEHAARAFDPTVRPGF